MRVKTPPPSFISWSYHVPSFRLTENEPFVPYRHSSLLGLLLGSPNRRSATSAIRPAKACHVGRWPPLDPGTEPAFLLSDPPSLVLLPGRAVPAAPPGLPDEFSICQAPAPFASTRMRMAGYAKRIIVDDHSGMTMNPMDRNWLANSSTSVPK